METRERLTVDEGHTPFYTSYKGWKLLFPGMEG